MYINAPETPFFREVIGHRLELASGCGEIALQMMVLAPEVIFLPDTS